MRFGSLFAGIGGIDLGLERAGMECAWQVENDDFCTKVLNKHWPNVPKFGDIKELTGDELEPVDLIAGGFPCQPVSLAGRGKGDKDERWLWPEFARLIERLRPNFVLGENVPGLRTRGLSTVLGDLEDIGYTARAFRLSAQDVGAPHIRKRLWIVAHTRSERRQQVARSTLTNEGPHERRTSEKDHLTTGDGQSSRGRVVADTHHVRRNGGSRSFEQENGRRQLTNESRWATEPNIRRVAHGVPARLDRLKSLGNAVVPQCAEFIGQLILESAA